MNVQTFAKQVGLSAHTLRYYEKIGLLTSVKRRTNGHRYFDEADVRWISFILRLKETGMALTDMVQY
ncbi:MerR family transcriptional regulator, partial [Acinetobacter baumannii]